MLMYVGWVSHIAFVISPLTLPAYGCRSSVFNFEARSLSAALSASGSMARRCVVAKLKELDGSIIKKLLVESVGSLLILLPDNFDDGMDNDLKEKLKDIETSIFGEETAVPLFFALESSELTPVFDEISTANAVGTEKAATALQVRIDACIFRCVYILILVKCNFLLF